jgi:glycosyltransferase involved in cell wall biosynthesis
VRIVLLTHSLFFGGAERQLVLLAKGLQQRGHTVVVVPFYSGGPLEHELVDAGIPIRSLHKKGRWDIWAIVRRLPQVIQQEVPHVVHSYHGTPNLMSLVLKLFRLPPKVIWGIRSSNMDVVHYDWVVAPLGQIIAWLSRFADAHIANSQTGLSHHVAIGYPAEKMVHIPNGVDTTRFRPDQAARVLVREEWGVSTEDRLIGLVARLDPIKGHPVFLEAASRLAHRDSSIKFVCVGDGPATYRGELQRHAQKLGLEDRMRWAGDRADMPAVQNALDLAVNSSLSEGLSNAISEAMACGVPCVVSDVGDSAWVVGSTGAIVPPNDPEALADAMGRMITAREPDPTTIRRRILDHLSVDALVINTERTLLALCHQPTGKPGTSREKTPVC